MMEGSANDYRQKREPAFSRTIRAGRRTYFFDVQSTRSNELYVTITESKKRFSEDQNKFYYEKHKLYLYREDFEKFSEGLTAAMDFVSNPAENAAPAAQNAAPAPPPAIREEVRRFADVSFEDLGQAGQEASVGEEALEEERVAAG